MSVAEVITEIPLIEKSVADIVEAIKTAPDLAAKQALLVILEKTSRNISEKEGKLVEAMAHFSAADRKSFTEKINLTNRLTLRGKFKNLPEEAKALPQDGVSELAAALGLGATALGAGFFLSANQLKERFLGFFNGGKITYHAVLNIPDVLQRLKLRASQTKGLTVDEKNGMIVIYGDGQPLFSILIQPGIRATRVEVTGLNKQTLVGNGFSLGKEIIIDGDVRSKAESALEDGEVTVGEGLGILRGLAQGAIANLSEVGDMKRDLSTPQAFITNTLDVYAIEMEGAYAQQRAAALERYKAEYESNKRCRRCGVDRDPTKSGCSSCGMGYPMMFMVDPIDLREFGTDPYHPIAYIAE